MRYVWPRFRLYYGSEFCSQIVDLWAYPYQVRIDFSRPGKPTANAHVESFNATLRRECLNGHWVESLREAQACIEAWRREYNESRPHRALQDRTPEEFAKRVAEKLLCEPVVTAGDSP
jgi:putative transposase